MSSELLERRKKVVARHDAALDRWWPDKNSPEYRREVTSVVAELEEILAEAESAGLSRLERSRTARWIADAYSDLSREGRVPTGEDLAHLAEAAAHYQLAGSLMEGEDSPRDTAILNFNYANTLKRFNIENTALLEGAKWRYQQALGYFTAEDPARVPQVRQALDQVLVGLQIAPLTKELAGMQERFGHLNELIENKASAADIQTGFDRFLEGGGPQSLVSRVMGVIENLPDSVRALDEDGKLQTLVSEMLLMSASAPGAKEREQNAEIFSALQERMEQEMGEGKVSGGRQAALRNAIGTINRLMSKQGDDVSVLRSNMLDMRTGAAVLIPALKNLSFGLPLPPEGSRAAAAREIFWGVRGFVFDQLTKGGKAEGESEALFTFGKQLTETERSLVESGEDDARALQIEAEIARPQAIEVRGFATRRRPYLADPIWSSAPARTDPNAVLYSGGEELGGPVEDWCTARDLTFFGAPSGRNFADARWRQISAANCAVFDMTSPTPRARAPVAYELGIAQTLGKAVLVVGKDGVPLPFDLDVPVVIIEEDGQLNEVMEAVDEALYRIPDPGTERSIGATVAEADRRFGGRKDAEISQTLKELQSQVPEPDPVEVGRCLETLVTFLGSSAPALITPVWVGKYPVPGELRLFHVMPFGPCWADETVAAVEGACNAVGCRYIRGDRVSDRDIIQSIWDEISTASHVLVDLTGFNENVAFELGIADTLGRPTLVVGQEDTVDHLFPMIEKLRFTTYRKEAIPSDLGNTIGAWIES